MNNKPSCYVRHHILVFVILLAITTMMFSYPLFYSDEIILSQQGSDISSQFLYWRDFGFSQMKAGNFPLWNPHIFSGAPFFGGFQSALLYPPNFIFLIFPLHKAINISIALHVFLVGFFMYLWSVFRGLHPLACILSSILIMFSGAHFMHIYAGHLTNLCTMAWVPLLLLSIDGLFERQSLGWILLGMFVVTMQILAGHPQYVYYTAITVFIYAVFRFFRHDNKTIIVLGISGIYIGGFVIGAVQILTGIDATRESVRGLGVSFEFASMFSFPPENFLTLLAPHFFGDMENLPYWGRCYLWEMSLFISITGLFLAFYGALYGDRNKRLFSITMVLVLSTLALGAHTPLFNILYQWLPGFDKFRGSSKFMFQASLFLIMLTGIGMDTLIREKHPPRKVTVAIFTTGILLGGIAFLIYISRQVSSLEELWPQMIHAVWSSHESYLPMQTYTDNTFIHQSSFFASENLFIAAGTCLLLSLLFFLTKFSKKMIYLIACLACAEVLLFAKISLPTFDFKSQSIPNLTKFYEDHPGDYRVLNLLNPNSSMMTGSQDIWGYDPGVLLRYAQFITYTQGGNLDHTTQYVKFTHYNRLYTMLKCRYVLVPGQNRIKIQEFKNVMPRLQLIQDWKMMRDYKKIFAEMEKTSFDPQKTVILETSPHPEPSKSNKMGHCTIVDSSTDHLTIKANLFAPSILLISDAYSTGWHIEPLADSIQNSYHILPANYVLMAIPLSAGNHLFKIEYLPFAFRIGKWTSIVSITIYFALLAVYWHKCRQKIFSER